MSLGDLSIRILNLFRASNFESYKSKTNRKVDSQKDYSIKGNALWPLGSCRKASGYRDAAVGSAWADLAGSFAETEDRTFGIQFHLLQCRFLITLLSALTHLSLQYEEWSIGAME